MPAIKPFPPTDALRAALIELCTNGAAALGVEPQLTGIAIYGEEEPDSAVAPYLVVDLSADPTPWNNSALWRQSVVLRLVQPVAIPDDPSVSLDYNSSAVDAYEHNLTALVLGHWPKTGVAYNPAIRSSFSTLSDLIAAAATEAEIDNLVLLDTAEIHSPDCSDAGPPLRAKLPITDDHELEFDLVLVAALTDGDL